MKLRKARKQFWWTWHFEPRPYNYSKMYGFFDWGVGRVVHQIKGEKYDRE